MRVRHEFCNLRIADFKSQEDGSMRALFMDFPNDPRVAEIGDEYMFGPAFLVPGLVCWPGSLTTLASRRTASIRRA